MQTHVLGDAAVVGIEVLVVPLVATVVRPGTIGPTVVATYRQHVLTHLCERGQVHAESHHAVLAEAQGMSVQIDIGGLSYSLELHKDLALHLVGRERKPLSVPTDSIGQIDDILAERLVPIKGIRQRHLLPT